MSDSISVMSRTLPYTGWHGEAADTASAAALPVGRGRYDGRRERLIVVAREAAWAEPVLAAATAQYGDRGFVVAMRPVCAVGRKRFAARPVAADAAELAAEIEASAAQLQAEQASTDSRRKLREGMRAFWRAVGQAAWRAEQDARLIEYAEAWGFVPDPSLGRLSGLVEVDHARAEAAIRNAGTLSSEKALAASYAGLFDGLEDGDIVAVRLRPTCETNSAAADNFKFQEA